MWGTFDLANEGRVLHLYGCDGGDFHGALERGWGYFAEADALDLAFPESEGLDGWEGTRMGEQGSLRLEFGHCTHGFFDGGLGVHAMGVICKVSVRVIQKK